VRRERYKNYLIFGEAIPDQNNTWSALGVILEVHSATELKRLKSANSFMGRSKAEEHGLELCKAWVDEQEMNV
jgi:hypothetical protein